MYKYVNSQSLQVVPKNLDISYERLFRNITRYPIFNKIETKVHSQPLRFSINDNYLAILKFRTPMRLLTPRNIGVEVENPTVTKQHRKNFRCQYLSKLIESAGTVNAGQDLCKNQPEITFILPSYLRSCITVKHMLCVSLDER